jgi:hypothetical protein
MRFRIQPLYEINCPTLKASYHREAIQQNNDFPKYYGIFVLTLAI